ncbi:hypothetical protein EON64_21120, partial [archaeon]
RGLYRQISARAEAEDFMYPVDRSVYPEYYEVIKSPMDLSTWSKGIPRYTFLFEALSSLRLIWANCLMFNQASSDIAVRAVKLGQFAEKIIEVSTNGVCSVLGHECCYIYSCCTCMHKHSINVE